MTTYLIYAAIAAFVFCAYTAFIKAGVKGGRPDYVAIGVASVAWPASLAFVACVFLYYACQAAFEQSIK